MTKIASSVQERLQSLSKEKSELLQLLRDRNLREKGGIKPHPRGITKGPVRAPTSWAQQRLWFIDQLEGGSAGYQVPLALRLRGDLDLVALQQALNRIMERHETLRSVIVGVGGDPMQEIAAEGKFELTVVDLSAAETQDREARIALHRMEEIQAGFSLGAGPLIRGRLLHVRPDEHVLLITMHHIIADGWSIGVLLQELEALYTAAHEGRSEPLPALPVQYADYAQWQRSEWGQGETLVRQLDYWQRRLTGAPPQLELPTDRPRPAVPSARGGNAHVALDAQLSQKLKAFAQRHEMTLFMVLFAGWAIVLSRLSGQNDLMIGTPVANRQRPEVEQLIGLFVNTLVLRVNVQADSSVAMFLKQVRDVTLGAYDHQDLPFEKLVEVLKPHRDRARNPLFQVMFVLHNEPRSELQLPGLTVTLESGADEPSILDLWMSLEESGNEITGYINYSADLFDRDTVERWVACFTSLLSAMANGAAGSLEDLQILSRAERRHIVEDFNSTKTTEKRGELIQVMFEAQADKTPDVTAVELEDDFLSFAELDRRANQLARFLKDKGIGPDHLVGLCVERSTQMVVCLLAILKAGGAYVPLDPSYPPQRLRFMLENANLRYVLTQEQYLGAIPPTAAQMIPLEAERKRIATYTQERIPATEYPQTAQNLAYLIYTSGSTGRPKGVQMPHDSMVNLIEWHRTALPINEGQRVLQFSPLSFDVAFQEIMSTLCMGGTLVLVDEWVRRDARAVAELINSRSIQQIFVPPLMLQSLAEAFSSTGVLPQSLRDVITAGEQLRITPEIAHLFAMLPMCRLHNHYGPTETHVVTACTLTGPAAGWPAVPDIGGPICNTQVFVLDRIGQPVPIGETGEVYIGGANVARGYLNRSDLTAQRFIANAFSSSGNDRLYRTGDMARWRANGSLIYVGRNDDQVKIRGYRIELGEIEAQLLRHGGIKGAAVIVCEDVPGEKRLVAYTVLREEGSLNAGELRTYLQGLLPEYMIPVAFVMLTELPLTPSGKLDRRSLPAPSSEVDMGREYEAPRGGLEVIIADIWQELLHVERVGRLENFFELGGHSLLGMKLIAKVAERCRVNLSAIAIFQSPTVQQMAEAVASLQESSRQATSLSTEEVDQGVL